MSSIVFKKLRYKNILSSGNHFTEYNFLNTNTTLIIGTNGSGKSTILDALAFALYGKPFRSINKPQLVNSINKKGLLVELEFQIGKKEYMIRRGIKPNVFEVFKGSVMINQDAAATEYQRHLEQDILKMSFKSFSQVVVLGSSTFKPFMQLKTPERRGIIEDLLDIEVFTKMNSIHKERVRENKEDLSYLDLEIASKESEIRYGEQNNSTIRKVEEKSQQDFKRRIKEKLDLIEQEKASIDKLQEEIEDLPDIQDRKTVEEDRSKASTEISILIETIREINQNMEFYRNNETCHTCFQDISEEFKNEELSKADKDIDVQRKQIKVLKDIVAQKERRLQEIQEIQDQINSRLMEISIHRNTIKGAKNDLISIKKEMEENQEEYTLVDVDSLRSDLAVMKEKQKALLETRELLSAAGVVLKDDGIKAQIVKQYIPVMNQLINKHLAVLDFFVQFELDSTFNETIKSRFRDVFSYQSFSEGEKARIDIALLLTWRAIAKMRNSVSTNLLIMDEVFDGSLDDAGTKSLMEILAKSMKDTNLYVISHDVSGLYEQFDSVLVFSKERNFSVMRVSK